jgi:hypothetical protein
VTSVAMYAWWSPPYDIVSNVGHPRPDPIGLCDDGSKFAHIGALMLYQRFLRTCKPYRKWVRAQIDCMELSYDGITLIYYVIISIYCIAYFLMTSTTLHDDIF